MTYRQIISKFKKLKESKSVCEQRKVRFFANLLSESWEIFTFFPPQAIKFNFVSCTSSVRALVSLFEDFICTISSEVTVWNELSRDTQQELTELVLYTIESGFLPDNNGSDMNENQYSEKFRNGNLATVSMQAAIAVLHWLSKCDLDQDCQLIKSIIVNSFILCIVYSLDEPWTDEKLQLVAEDLHNVLDLVCYKSAKIDLFNFLKINENSPPTNVIFKDKMFDTVLSYLQPKLTKEKWRQNPCYKKAFYHCLMNVNDNQVAPNLDHILPPSLIFVDDYSVKNQILGIKCLHKIINDVPATDLCLYGRVEVIYGAVDHLTYSRDPNLIDVLYPCLISTLKIVESKQAGINWTRCDEKLLQVLSNMEFEQIISLRTTYSKHLRVFIELLGSDNVKHLKHFLNVFENYLELSDGSEELSRRNILKAFKDLILNTRPRIFNHVEQILKILLKLLYDIEDMQASSEVKEEMIMSIARCIQLVRAADRQQFEVTMKVIHVTSLVLTLVFFPNSTENITVHPTIDSTPKNVTTTIAHKTTIAIASNTTTTIASKTTMAVVSNTTMAIASNTTTAIASNTTVGMSENTTVSLMKVTNTTTPAPLPTPTDGHWNVTGKDGVVCILLNMAVQVHVSYNETKSGKMVISKFNVPGNATVNSDYSTCNGSHHDQIIQLDYENDSFLRFVFSKDDSKFYIGHVVLRYNLTEDSHSIENTVSANVTEFKTSTGNSMICKVEKTVTLDKKVKLVIKSIHVQAYRKKVKASFGESVNCESKHVIQIPVIVPIIVGCILGGMLLVVAVAFIIGKRRFLNRPYENL